ncbi:DctP family TRAP transporter solute-binding subunit [Thermanaerosceptrum fracticalcis]|uniref:DctP family TRAP transporter solute-binding subunit n=1 Tax=Thermanaerosceptrum fracticalcis TaxID=1712410 RepID=A0A7G6E7U6_THEFR|nr:TRAP transporter substrate-binding protein [Thermanaerosceptrum fracticalcis]QNB48150.1 DctP family TRAP transporter solute-binding subunit [Thermanaerosceptrum fracticalcis]
MKNIKSLTLFMIFILMFTLFTGCSSGGNQDTNSSAKGKVVLKLGHTGAPDHHYQEASLMFAKKVAEKTNNLVEIKVFPSDQLGKQNELIEGAQLGTVDMVLTSDVQLSSFEPLLGVVNLPFLFKDFDHVTKVFNGPVGDKLAAALDKKGLTVLGWWENGFRHITNSKRPINTPADLKGLKIRTPNGAVFVDTFNMLGASATPMSFGELYSALQLKTVDGQENPTTHILTQKYYEVQSYLSLSNHIHVVEPLLISKVVYEKLSSEYQKALKEAAKEVSIWEFEKVKTMEAGEIEELKKKGMKVNTVNLQAFQEATKEIYAKYEPKFTKELIEEIRAAGK